MKKPRRFFALSLVIVILVVSGSLVALGLESKGNKSISPGAGEVAGSGTDTDNNTDTGNDGTNPTNDRTDTAGNNTRDISLTAGINLLYTGGISYSVADPGNSYSLDDQGNVTISYRNGQDKAAVPLTLSKAGLDNSKSGMLLPDTVFYITNRKTAVAAGNEQGHGPVKVLVSGDQGKTWNTGSVTDPDGGEPLFTSSVPVSIGFSTPDDGWLVTVGDVAMGTQFNCIFLTSDGGKTWRKAGSSNDFYHRVVTGACFSDDPNGFLAFRYDGVGDTDPVLWRTADGGKTWTRCDIKVPEAYKQTIADYSYAESLTPVYDGASVVLPVRVRTTTGDGEDLIIRFISSDGGKTWEMAKAN